MPFDGLPSGNWRIQRFPSNGDVFVNLDVIQDSFQLAVSKTVRIFPEGIDRYQIFTPFHFDDGDHLVIILKKKRARELDNHGRRLYVYAHELQYEFIFP